MAKFFLTVFAVLAATQVLPSSGSCVPCNNGPSHGQVGYAAGSYGPSYSAGPLYLPSGPAYGSSPLYLPAGSAPSDCSVPPVYLPAPTFPNLPTIHAPKPLTIPLQVPSVIPVGRVCVCKAIQIQPSVVQAPKPVYNYGCGKDVVIPAPAPSHGHGSSCGC